MAEILIRKENVMRLCRKKGMIMGMITVEHLTKRYGEFTAVNDLSFEIEEGHVYGFL